MKSRHPYVRHVSSVFLVPCELKTPQCEIVRATIDLDAKIRTGEENLKSLPKKQNNFFC